MMPEYRDDLEELLSNAFRAGVPEPEYEADDASPEEVPADLKARALKEAREFSTRLLARRLCAAGEQAGWNIDDLVSEAPGYEVEAKRLLCGGGTPLELEPRLLARIFFRARFGPSQWAILLFQSVASEAVYREAPHGEIWGRTTGLSDLNRAQQLSDTAAQKRDPTWAERVASGFVDEVLEEWKKLTTGMKS